MNTIRAAGVTIAAFSALIGHPVRAQAPVSLEDVIGMVRVPHFWGEQPFFAISRDGKSGAAITWQGDIKRNVNVYKLYVFDVAKVAKDGRLGEPAAVLDFPGDTNDYGFRITGMDEVRVHTDPRNGHPVATFLHGDPKQVYAVDGVTRKMRQLTRSPTSVKVYAMGKDGELAIYAAEAGHTDVKRREHLRKLARDSGVTLSDTAFFPPGRRWNYVLRNDMYVEDYVQPNLFEFFTLKSPNAKPKSVLKLERSGGPFLSVSPDGKTALFTPYHAEGKDGSRFGLIELASGKITQLVDAPAGNTDYELRRWMTRTARHKDIDSPSYPLTGTSGFPIWSPDGKTLVLYTSLPGPKPDSALPAQWVEIDLSTRRTTPVRLAEGWVPLTWDQGRNALIMVRGGVFAALPRSGNGWGAMQTLGSANDVPDGPGGELATARFNPMYAYQANGSVALGVADNLAAPPEYALYDFTTKQLKLITDLNPWIKQRKLGPISVFRWRGIGEDTAAFGFLVLPPDGGQGKPYPLALADRHSDNFGYIIDGMGQYSAVAAQTLAAGGVATMIIPEPRFPRGGVDTDIEGKHAVAYFGSAVDALVKAGIADRAKIGLLGGWSRAGFWTDYMIIHDPDRYAVASSVDGGSRNYIIERRWTHEQLMRVKAPLLLQPHGHFDIKKHGQYADHLRELGKPVDLLWLPTAPHDVRIPSHRMRSLQLHTDWFRFWLQGYEDPSPTKKLQYERWRLMRKRQPGLL